MGKTDYVGKPPCIVRVVLLLLILAAFATRLHRLGSQSLWRDEIDAVYFAVRHLPNTLSMFVQAGQNGALYFLSLRPWFRLVGTSEFALRYPSVWFAVLATPLLWQVARRLAPTSNPAATSARVVSWTGVSISEGEAPAADPGLLAAPTSAPSSPLIGFWDSTIGNAPLLAALFFVANPYLLWYGQEGKMYTVAIALTLLATWFWLRGIEFGGCRPWLGYFLTVTLAIYSHLLMVVIIPLHMVWFLLAWPQSKSQWRGYGLALAGLTLPYLPMLVWQWELLTDGVKRTGFNFTPLPEMLETLLLDYTRGFMPPDEIVWLAPIFFLGLAGLTLGFLEIHVPAHDSLPKLSVWRRHLLIASWIAAPVLVVYAMSLRQPIFTPRYLIWISSAGFIFLGLGLQLVWRNSGPLAKPLSVLLMIYVVGLWAYVGWEQQTETVKYDLRGGVTYIATRRSPEELLILQIPHMEYAYRYYSSELGPDPMAGSDERLARWAGGLWTNNGWADEQARADVDRRMRELTANVETVWILRSEVEMWDQRYLMDEWLNEHGDVVDAADFHGAQVRRYLLY